MLVGFFLASDYVTRDADAAAESPILRYRSSAARALAIRLQLQLPGERDAGGAGMFEWHGVQDQEWIRPAPSRAAIRPRQQVR